VCSPGKAIHAIQLKIYSYVVKIILRSGYKNWNYIKKGMQAVLNIIFRYVANTEIYLFCCNEQNNIIKYILITI